MRRDRAFRPVALDSLEERRVPSHLVHVTPKVAHKVNVHVHTGHVNVRVHVGRRVNVHAPYFNGSFPGTNWHGPVVVHTPWFSGVFNY
jgi:hypothetical protein